MRVSRLRILGFKSFAEKVELAFGPGITAFVGPNGCGKTNVVEALRWVLGEQNPRVLRCSRMDEVIFAGSSTRKPLGMAEVAISIEDDGGGLPGGTAEMEVTRRLFKDGQSDYVINRQPVLLRDVKDAFLDVGFGTEGYSLLERDMVDQVLKDPTGTRRQILEQAAGIARYRDRSRRAVAKLEASRQDMLRLSDVLGEVKTQVISLARQAGRAERYRECQEEIRKLSRSLIALESERLSARRRSLEQQARRSDQKRRKAMENLQESERRLREATRSREASEQRIAGRRQQLEVLNREKEDAERQERYLLERLTEERHRAASFRDREQRERDRLSRTHRESLEIARQAAGLKREVRSCEERAESVRADLEAVIGQRGELAPRIARLDKTLREERERVLSRQKEHGRLAERRHLTGEQLERLRQREQRAAERLQRLHARREELASEHKGARTAARKLQSELEACRSELESGEKRLSALERDSSAIGSRIEFLRALQQEGFTPFERLLDRPGVVGCIGQLVSVDDSEWEQAVNGALGDASEWLVVMTWSDAVRVASEASTLPRGKILVLEEFMRSLEGKTELRPGAIVEHVSAPAEVSHVVGHLLGRTAPAGSLEEAKELVEGGGWSRAATRSGDVVEKLGVLEVGQLRAVVGSAGRLADEEKKLEEVERARNVARRDTGEFRSRCDEVARRLEQERAQELVRRSEVDRLADESTEVAALLEQLRTDRNALEHRISSLGAPEEEDEPLPEMGELDALRDQDRSLGREESEHRNVLSELDRTAAGMLGRIEGMAGELRRLAALRREARETAAEALAEAARSSDRVAELSRELDDLRAELEAAGGKLAPLAEEIAGLEAELQRVGEQVDKWEGSRTSAWQRLEESRESLHSVEIEQARMAATGEALNERALRELNCSVDELGEPEVSGPAEELSRRIAELTERRDGMGSVNFAAEQEHTEAKERHDFLEEQLRDLTEARGALEQAMERMKETAKELFVATLEQVRANFRYTFGELFRGGEADLRLLDEDDPLESGVDIVACPGGKRLRRIEVLSGGERALTAIALLFAIYLVRPSPFCILDEVDAPLDDANVDRFLGVLGSFASGSQFVIVTHNRRTMKAADALYGITMGEPGVSQVVSVKLPEN